MPGSLMGTSVIRVEDPDLIRGHTTFVDSLRLPGMLHLAFVRSPFAHAEVVAIDVTAAMAIEGVEAVFTGADLDLAGFVPFGAPMHPSISQPALGYGRVRFVGEAVAVVVATTKAAAADGVQAVEVDYTPLPAVVDAEEALSPGAPLLFDGVPGNLAAGFQDDVDALDDAEVVVRGRFVNQRMAVVAMEGNAIAVVPATDADDPFRFTIHLSTQQPHGFHKGISRYFDIPLASLRVIAPHVGGGFGGKVGLAGEYIVAVEVARRLGCPVTWASTRSEDLVSMAHGRAQVHYIEMGFTNDGHITGMRARVVGDSGAYAGFGGGFTLAATRNMAQGVYKIPKITYAGAVAVTNTTPIGAFRGAGRPEAAAYLERIMDIAADQLAIDPIELRRKNLLPSEVFPYTTVTGMRYDVGDYHAALDEAEARSGYEALLAEQQTRRDAGDSRLLGIGVATYVEITAMGGGKEFGSVEVHANGTATVSAGTSAHGQGHATTFGTIAADILGIDFAKIRYVQSDTALVAKGGGTGGSRSLQLGGSAVHVASSEMLAKGRDLAAQLLEANPADIISTGTDELGVAGVPSRSVTWAQLAQHVEETGGGPLRVALDNPQAGATFPFGAHVAVVEIDIETGRVDLIRHIAVDDCGTVLNPMIVTGQQHGGIAAGAGQALYEQFVYDRDGNPLTSTLAEYAMPSAAEFPSFETYNTQTPTPLNPLGAKGIGESGTIGSTPSIQNAVVDALSHLGVRHVDMPCTPERVWVAINRARDGVVDDPWVEPPAFFAALEVRSSQDKPVADVAV